MRDRVSSARVARLATVRPDGQPHLVPITFALDGERLIWAVDHKPKGTTQLQRLRNLESHPGVTVLVDHYDEDWSALWWVRMDGRAATVPAGAARQAALDLLIGKYESYRERAPEGPVVAIEIEHWKWWSAS